jgi:hypothetical protein
VTVENASTILNLNIPHGAKSESTVACKHIEALSTRRKFRPISRSLGFCSDLEHEWQSARQFRRLSSSINSCLPVAMNTEFLCTWQIP